MEIRIIGILMNSVTLDRVNGNCFEFKYPAAVLELWNFKFDAWNYYLLVCNIVTGSRKLLNGAGMVLDCLKFEWNAVFILSIAI